MGITIKKEVNRLPGYLPKTGVSIIPGNVVKLDTGTLDLFDNAADEEPIGFAIDSNVLFPFADASGQTAGKGYDYTNYNRGGLIAVFIGPGTIFELFDDGRGHPCITSDTYVVNKPVYSDSVGKITAVVGANFKVGTVVSVTGSGANLVVEIKTTI